MRRGVLFLAAAAALLVLPAQARSQERESLHIGLRVGAYMPLDEAVRDRFGTVLPLFGVARAMPPRPGRFSLFPSLEVSGARAGSDRFLVVPLTLVGEYQFPGNPRVLVPFVRGEGGVAYYDYRVRMDSATTARARRGGPVGAAEAGVMVTPYLRASARYRLFGEYDGLDFRGVELNLVVGSLRLY